MTSRPMTVASIKTNRPSRRSNCIRAEYYQRRELVRDDEGNGEPGRFPFQLNGATALRARDG